MIARRICLEHLRWTHLEQVQHSTDLPRQVTFPVHTEQGKMGPRLDERYCSSREEIEETKTGKRKAGEEKKQATDFKEAVCCPSVVVQRAARQKMKGSAWGNWDPWESQQLF